MPPEELELDDNEGTLPAMSEEDEGYVPEGYDTEKDFLDYALKLYQNDENYDRENREWALEDLEFLAGDQWDETIKADREAEDKPCLTINVLPQFVGQVIGDRRINKTTIKVRPFKDGTEEIAEIRSGLIKSIELFSRAERAYDAACEDQVGCGIGGLRVDLEYAGNDVFDQDIFIRHIPNPLAVLWDRMSVDPTGRDAKHCFVTDKLPREVFEKNFPDYPVPTGGFGTNNQIRSGWWDSDSVRVTEFWELIDKPAVFAMMMDGSVEDVTDKDPASYEGKLWRHPVTGATKVRKSFRTYARMHLVTGFCILGKPYEVPCTRLPIVRVEGRTVRVGDDRVRFGLVRFAKDSQRLKNYSRSVAAETIALAPQAQWAGPADAFEGLEEHWDRAHLNGAGPLIWNKNASAPPERLAPPQMPTALLQEAQLYQQDIKDTTGIQDASLGVRSNEVSGKAINARKLEGDVATSMYHDNLNCAIEEVGDIVNQYIPIAYDSTRTIRVIGPDDKHKLMVINGQDDESPDITKGKYDVVLETGPSFTTQRQEALDGMMTLFQTAPDLLPLFLDILAKNMDWPGAYEIAERAKNMPQIKQLAGEDDQGDGQGQDGQPNPAQMLQMQQLQQAQAALEAEQQQQQEATAQAQAKTEEAKANASTAIFKARQAEAQAEEAEARAEQARIEARHAPRLMDQKYRLAERAASAKERSVKNRGAGPRPGGDRSNGAPTKGNDNDSQE